MTATTNPPRPAAHDIPAVAQWESRIIEQENLKRRIKERDRERKSGQVLTERKFGNERINGLRRRYFLRDRKVPCYSRMSRKSGCTSVCPGRTVDASVRTISAVPSQAERPAECRIQVEGWGVSAGLPTAQRICIKY